MQNLPPRLLHRHLQKFDNSIRLMVSEAAINIMDMNEDDLTLRRMRLPIRLKGAGLRRMNGWLTHAAFIGGLLRTLPELSTRTLPGNRSRVGMHNELASELLGTTLLTTTISIPPPPRRQHNSRRRLQDQLVTPVKCQPSRSPQPKREHPLSPSNVRWLRL